MKLPGILLSVAAISLWWGPRSASAQTQMITQPGSAASSRVVTLPPPPSRQGSEVATPAHAPLPSHKNALSPSNPSTQLPPPPLPAPQAQSAVRFPAIALPAFPPASSVLPITPTIPTYSNNPPQFQSANQNPTQQNAALVAYGAPQFAAQAAPVAEEFTAGQLIAVVGTEHILAGDMAVFVEPIIEQNRARITSPEEEQKIRNQLTRQALRQYCEIKGIYQEFFRDMVGTVPPKELEETKKKVVTRAGKIFFEKQVPVLMEKYKVTTIQELERQLNDKSLSLTTLRGQFVEQVLASELERKHVPDKFEIARQDLLNAYQQDGQEKWGVAGRARWRQVTVRFDKHATRQEAEAKLRELGNEMLLGGKPFDAVARQSSEGFTASEGGRYDWTTQGSLKSKELDQALFTLPLNSLSQVIADDIGVHIIEVLERELGHVKDFTEAQAELRQSLSDERRSKEVRDFRARIMDRTTIWTLWPEDIPGSLPLAAALGEETD